MVGSRSIPRRCLLVAFTRASDAAAEEAQRALEIPVRIGIHTGQPTLTGEGYVGIDVHRAARICAAGHGGRVILSQHALVDGYAVKDLGLHRLKDLQEPERLYQLGEQEFPPLRSLNATNLPVQPNRLVDRERELEQLQALVRGGARLTGPGGSARLGSRSRRQPSSSTSLETGSSGFR